MLNQQKNFQAVSSTLKYLFNYQFPQFSRVHRNALLIPPAHFITSCSSTLPPNPILKAIWQIPVNISLTPHWTTRPLSWQFQLSTLSCFLLLSWLLFLLIIIYCCGTHISYGLFASLVPLRSTRSRITAQLIFPKRHTQQTWRTSRRKSSHLNNPYCQCAFLNVLVMPQRRNGWIEPLPPHSAYSIPFPSPHYPYFYLPENSFNRSRLNLSRPTCTIYSLWDHSL